MIEHMDLRTTDDIAAASAALIGDLSAVGPQERALLDRASDAALPDTLVGRLRQDIEAGLDPLGDAYTSIVSPADRRPKGQTYTPNAIVEAMLHWAVDHGKPERIVDPGVGSGRYLLAAARVFPDATLVGLDIDPLATLMLRASLTAAGFADRATVMLGDYRKAKLPRISGSTLYIGNPPYVRHHDIDEKGKNWLALVAAKHGLRASKLAGLHIHFFLATAEHARPGDYGAFVTSAEWLDVNYGSVLRDLLLNDFGGTDIHVIDAEAQPFADAQTTAAITGFVIGKKPESLRFRSISSTGELGRLNTGRVVTRERLAEANRWSVFLRTGADIPEGLIELGELARVHRGAVTGANDVWVQQRLGLDLPEDVLYPAVTKARELFAAGERLSSADSLRVVVGLPEDLDVLDAADRKRVDRFVRKAKAAKVPSGYVASKRRAWWSVSLRDPAPVLATYMARRPPAFVRNDASARHINIAHGLYPRQQMSDAVLDKLAAHLRTAVSLAQGRRYAGGLTKFEPKEMERLLVPSLEELEATT